MDSDEENHTDWSTDDERKAKKFPTPKFIFTISSPCIVTVNRNDASPDMKDFTIRGALLRASQQMHQNNASIVPTATSTTSSGACKKPLKIKMSSLIIKMVNNLVAREMIAFEAVQILSSAGNIEVRILLDHGALPILMDRCEQIGVGSVVGTCHAVPIETALLPPAGPPKKLVFAPGAVSPPCLDPAGALSTTSTGSVLGTLNDDDEGSCISENYNVEEEEKKESDSKTINKSNNNKSSEVSEGKSRHGVHLLSSERKAQLQKQVATAREEWLKTASRVRVEQVVEEVYAGASLTWDYIAFTICAAIIAATGLVTDSGVSVLASMLVSPIMGPVLGFTFGTTIRRKSLIVIGCRNEIISLIICILVGMVMCTISVLWGVDHKREWPSSEMLSRADEAGIISGIFVAIPSGAAVALSTLGKNSSGLTGVAISLSLLPPAVNAGVCWMYGLLLLSDNDMFERNEGDENNYFHMGGVSFGLTLVNIACIYVAALFMFWLKEVAPIQKKNAFWSQDVKIARDDEGRDVDTKKIEDGLEAVIELNNGAPPGRRADFNKVLSAPVLSHSVQVGDARRKAMAANAVEDAFFFGGSEFAGDVGTEIVGGKALNDALPEKRRTAMSQSLAVAANKFGGLHDAGEALFDSTLYNSNRTAPHHN